MRLMSILFFASFATIAQPKVFDLDKSEDSELMEFLSKKKVIVVGEMHGTAEVPQFVLRLVKMLKEKNKPLTVGLEISNDLQRDIDKFMKTGDFGKLLELDYFKVPDGRTSIAMGNLMKALQKMKGIKIVCFDVDSKSNFVAKKRDSLMGINLATRYRNDKMIMLTGNLHANLKEGYWKPGFKSAVYHFQKIKKFGTDLISLNTYFISGTIWNCMQDGCKERAAFSSPGVEKKGLTNFVSINDKDDLSGYDGFVYFDKVNASWPLCDQHCL